MAAGWWSATANFQQYQTLQPDPKNLVLWSSNACCRTTPPNARRSILDIDWMAASSGSTNFTKRGQMINGVQVKDPDGQRTVLYPHLLCPSKRRVGTSRSKSA